MDLARLWALPDDRQRELIRTIVPPVAARAPFTCWHCGAPTDGAACLCHDGLCGHCQSVAHQRGATVRVEVHND